MNEKTILEESYPALEVSDDLRQRVKRLATESDATRDAQSARRTTTRRVALIGTVATIAIVGVAIGPRVATAAEFWRVQSALGKLKSAHIIQWQRTENKGRETRETWFSGDSVRMQSSDGSVQIFTGGHNYFYNPESGKVIRKGAEGPYAYNPSGFTVDALKRDLAGSVGWNTSIESVGETRESGKLLQKLVFYHTEPAGKIRHTLFVDPATRLPQRMEIALEEKNGAWTPIGGGELRYDEAFSPVLFAPRFPGATLVDADALRSQWLKHIENVVAEARLGERTVKIRDVQVNAQGAIFVLYTCDKTWEDGFSTSIGGGWWPDSARDWDLRISGYRRQKMNFGDYYNKTEKRRSSLRRPVLDNGGRLLGDWFIPIADKPLPPAEVKIDWVAHPRNLHGDELERESHTAYGIELTPQEQQLKDIPARQIADRLQVRKGWTARVTVPVAVTPTNGSFAPEYWPYVVCDYDSEPRISQELLKEYTRIREEIHQDKGY